MVSESFAVSEFCAVWVICKSSDHGNCLCLVPLCDHLFLATQ